MASAIHYTDIANRVRVLDVETYRKASQLFKYAVSCATADVLIELVRDGIVVKSHKVEYTMPENIEPFSLS